jgi:signal transduction histidine kinase
MTIRSRLSLLFTGLMAVILLLFALAIYMLSSQYRDSEFDGRLHERAYNAAEFVEQMDNLDPTELAKFSKTGSEFLAQESELVYDLANPKHPIVYTSGNFDVPAVHQYFYDIENKKSRHISLDDESEMFGLLYQKNGKKYVAIAKAYDQYGLAKQDKLKQNLTWAWLGGVLLVFGLSLYYTKEALNPIKKVIDQVEKIGFQNLKKRVRAGKDKDEIWSLANTFNGMLERLSAAFDSQKSFVSNASHELRTPLTAMNGQIEVALLKDRSPEEYKKTLLSIKEDISEMTELTNNLLDLAAVESGVAKLNFETVRIDELLWESQEQIQQKIPTAKIEIDFEIDPENFDDTDFELYANDSLLKTALNNLTENGCKYSPNQHVIISLGFKDKACHISFKNAGTPINPEEIPHLFTAFYRAENKKKIRGHGIGLALTYKIAQLHGGNLSVESTAENGTNFTLQLPKQQ